MRLITTKGFVVVGFELPCGSLAGFVAAVTGVAVAISRVGVMFDSMMEPLVGVADGVVSVGSVVSLTGSDGEAPVVVGFVVSFGSDATPVVVGSVIAFDSFRVVVFWLSLDAVFKRLAVLAASFVAFASSVAALAASFFAFPAAAFFRVAVMFPSVVGLFLWGRSGVL